MASEKALAPDGVKCSKHARDAVESVVLVRGGRVRVLELCSKCRDSFAGIWWDVSTDASALMGAKEVRAWYKLRGEIGDRGRIPGFVWAAYQAWDQRQGGRKQA